MRTRAEQLDFIRLNLNALAFCAWQGYQANGRGVVCVLVDEHNENTQLVPFDFLPDGEAAEMVKDWRQNRESQLVAEYDPTTEVVVMFGHTKEGREDYFNVDCYRFRSRPAPPMAEEP
jgi:hypothetical protein